MPTFSIAVLTAFSSGLLTSLVFSRAPTCACDCTPSSEGAVILDLLRSQLDRCGPQELGIPVASLREVEAAASEAASKASAVAGEVRYSRNLLLVVLFCASAFGSLCSLRPRSPHAALGNARAVASIALEDGPRWSPPQGSRARQL